MSDFLVIETKNIFGDIFRVKNTFSPKKFLLIFYSGSIPRASSIFGEGMQTPGAVHLDLKLLAEYPRVHYSHQSDMWFHTVAWIFNYTWFLFWKLYFECNTTTKIKMCEWMFFVTWNLIEAFFKMWDKHVWIQN